MSRSDFIAKIKDIKFTKLDLWVTFWSILGAYMLGETNAAGDPIWWGSYGWLAFLAANLAGIPLQIRVGMGFSLVRNCMFLVTTLIGIWKNLL